MLTTQLLEKISEELNRARAKHPTRQNSRHEGFAILLEEVDEVKEGVWHNESNKAVAAELIQVAAMAIRMIEDLNLLEGK